MEIDNETIADISGCVRHLADALPNGVTLNVLQCNLIADRIESAHLREVSELRKCLNEAVDYNCAMCKSKGGNACEVEGFCSERRWRKALETTKGSEDECK